jgi:hypothetical protein
MVVAQVAHVIPEILSSAFFLRSSVMLHLR